VLSTGTVIDDKYLIQSIIGSGAVGCVYHATQVGFERSVALKIIRPDLFTQSQLQARFLQEAQLLSTMCHPNIPLFLGSNILADGSAYIAMEFVDGENLRSVLTSKSILPVSEMESYFTQICSALQHAHAAGVVHRDLKPENIIVTAFEKIKVIDFGFAKLVDEFLSPDQIRTKTDLIVGTPAYMSPEQRHGPKTNLDHRSDIYSLGCIMFECLIGVPPFDASDLLSNKPKEPRFHAIHGQPLPEHLVGAIKKCLHAEPSKRFQSAEQLASVLNKHDKQSVAPGWSKKRIGVVSACLTACAVAVVGLSAGLNHGFNWPGIKPASTDRLGQLLRAELISANAEVEQRHFTEANKRLQILMTKYSEELKQPARRTARTIILTLLSQISQAYSDWPAARKYQTQLLDELKSESPEDDLSIASALISLWFIEGARGGVVVRSLYLDEARLRLDRAKQQAQQGGADGRARYLKSLWLEGVVAFGQNHTEEAIKIHEELVERLSPGQGESRVPMFSALQLLVIEYRKAGNSKKSTYCLSAAEKLAEQGDEQESQRLYKLMAEHLLLENDLEDAKHVLEKVHDQGVVQMLEANAAYRRRDLPFAIAKYTALLKLMKERHLFDEEISTVIMIAILNANQNKHEEARKWTQQAERLASSDDMRKSILAKQHWLSLAKAYAENGDSAGAARASKMAQSIK
jgi:serine/threonine protein kinase